MKSILTAALMAIAVNSFAQDTNTIGKYQIKLYGLVTTNASSIQSGLPNRAYTPTTYVHFNHILNPTFAVNKQTKKGNRHEVELTSLSINETTERTSYSSDSTLIWSIGGNVVETKFIMRYEYIYVFMKGKKFQPSIGAAVSPYYVKYNYSPLYTSAYPFRESAFGIQTFIVPRLSYNISKRFFMDVNVPLKITENQFSRRVEYSSTLPTAERYTNKSNFVAFEDMFYARLGIGVNL